MKAGEYDQIHNWRASILDTFNFNYTDMEKN